MASLKNKFRIVALLLICVSVFATCEFVKGSDSGPAPLSDTIFLSQWRREKAEKIQLITRHENELIHLQNAKDSLQSVVSETKKITSSFRSKANYFQDQLKKVIAKKDSSKIEPDSLTPIVDSLILAQEQSDTACDKTIVVLEKIISNRDSAIVLHNQVEINLKDIQKMEELKNTILTEQLNASLKEVRKKSRHNKIMAGGLLILSGITTSLLISQSIK